MTEIKAYGQSQASVGPGGGEGGWLEIERKLEVGKGPWVPRAWSQILLWAIGRFLGGKIQW